jgi:hypothetical protein
VRGESWQVDAHRADANEHARLWPLLVAYNPPYQTYQEKTDRAIAVVVLRRAD